MNNERFKNLNKLAIPLLIQSVANYFINITDQLIIGRISTPAFNAVNIISSFLMMLAGILGCITLIFNIRGGKAFGKKDNDRLQFEFISSILISTIIGLLSIVFIFIFREYFLREIYKLPHKSIQDGMIYLNSMCFYILFQLYLFAFGTYFRIINNTKYILITSLISSIINLGIDYIFVLGKFGMPKLGINIVGVSTVLAMFINLRIYYYILRKEIKIDIDNFKKYFENSLSHLKSSFPIMGQELLEGTIFVTLINMIISRIGSNELAGYFIITNLLAIVNIAKHIYGSANLTLTSIGYGNKNYEDLINYPRISSILITIITIIISIILIVNRKYFSAIILKDNIKAVDIANLYLVYFVIANIFSSFSYNYRCSLQGLEENKYILYRSFIINLFSMMIMLILVNVFNLSLLGVSISILINELLLGIVYYKKYKKKIIRYI